MLYVANDKSFCFDIVQLQQLQPLIFNRVSRLDTKQYKINLKVINYVDRDENDFQWLSLAES